MSDVLGEQVVMAIVAVELGGLGLGLGLPCFHSPGSACLYHAAIDFEVRGRTRETVLPVQLALAAMVEESRRYPLAGASGGSEAAFS